MSTEIRPFDRLESKLQQAFSTSWGTRSVLRPEIADVFEHPETRAISGVLRLYVGTRSGKEAVAYEQQFENLRDAEAVDGFLAEALSSLLAVHSSWPR